MFVVHSGGGDLYGPFETAEEAMEWVEKEFGADEDFDIQELIAP